MGELKKVNDKILEHIIESTKMIFVDLSKRDERIIRENYSIKTSSWDSLGAGMKHVVANIITPMTVAIYTTKIQKAVLKDTIKSTR